MPPHLHPRSLLTTSLFTSTLAISFLVVGLPHLLPCPVQPKAFADSQDPSSPNQRRRRRPKSATSETGTDGSEGVAEGKLGAEAEEHFMRGRECPVPKPGGLIGTVLGFEKGERAERPVVRIAPLAERISRPRTEGDGGQG